MNSTTYNPFRLPLKNRFFASVIERVLGLHPLGKLYDKRPEVPASHRFLNYTLSALRIKRDENINQLMAQKVPKEGPLLVIANHPLGGLEGVLLAEALMSVRSDVKVITNEILTKIPELAPIFIGVDVLSTEGTRKNAKGLREASKHLRSGGVLLLFPAGMVSAINTKTWRIEDRPWNRIAGLLAKKYQVDCLPIYVKGRNSQLFYGLGLIHPRLRTLMLARELANKKGRSIQCEVGDVVSRHELKDLDDDVAVTNYLRMVTDLLAVNSTESSLLKDSTSAVKADVANIESASVEHLQDYKLLSRGDFSVYCAPYAQLGDFMNHIGRVREVTFAAAGEGTGKEIDTDHFDPYYWHLFVWDDVKQKVAGGYRVGEMQKIVQAKGIKGLYSRSLYKFNNDYIEKLGAAVEVGRSFVALDYQRNPAILDSLWRGIGNFMAANPQYHTLFGAVSISREHSDLARTLISECMLESFRAEQQYLHGIEPITPLKTSGKVWTQAMLASINSISLLNKLIGRCDPGMAVPVLLRHYLSLNGRFVCFSVNESFNDSLDGLIVVDLRQTPEKYIKRYLGKDGAVQFKQKWKTE